MVRGGIDDLRSRLEGAVLLAGEPGYDESRSLWNGEIDRHPAIVARCRSAADVSEAVRFATREGLEIAVRGGGHAYSGSSTCDAGMMIDLSEMNTVRVDPVRHRAFVGGGAKLADLDAATQEHGLAVPAGVISHTGVGGLTLGGGLGHLTSTFGLTIDNLEAAEMVLADGRIVDVSPEEHPDLFWAIRGGGGNFGVVTTFEFRLHPVGPMVNLGLLFWTADRGVEALRAMADAIPQLPPRTGTLIGAAMNAPPAPFVPAEYHFALGQALILVGFGTPEEHEQALAPIRAACPPTVDFVTPMPYTELQKVLDDDAPWGVRGYEKALYLDDLTDEAIEVVAAAGGRKRSALSFMPIIRLDGAFTDVADEDTAFGGRRRPCYVVNIGAHSFDLEEITADRLWVRETWDALRPLANDAGGYVNFMTEQDVERVRASYGAAKFDRLAAIKAEYDPGNVFHRNPNIKPG
jgi:FAD/FMN-containing dehydrogenase